ncbi:MAG: aldehyde dehydrogenase family protein [Tepidimonas fonticaldi]|nr:aldehyde dehydrogenase family protein [Tepidimonas fonticaldi]
MGPVAVLDPPAGCALMREEIFGPLLPIVPYDGGVESAMAVVHAGPRPLALYLFERDRRTIERVLHGTVSGGVTVNDCMLHQPQHGLPFGGIGPSGMGAYHGRHGFDRFSHLKGVYLQHPLVGAVFDRWVRPPYGAFSARLLRWMLRR